MQGEGDHVLRTIAVDGGFGWGHSWPVEAPYPILSHMGDATTAYISGQAHRQLHEAAEMTALRLKCYSDGAARCIGVRCGGDRLVEAAFQRDVVHAA